MPAPGRLVAAVDLGHLAVPGRRCDGLAPGLLLVVAGRAAAPWPSRSRRRPGRPAGAAVRRGRRPGAGRRRPSASTSASRRPPVGQHRRGRPPRSARCWRRSRSAVRWKVPARTSPTPRAHSRRRSSSAALRLKVQTSTWSPGTDPSWTRRATRRVSTRVLPAPAPASTQSTGSSAPTASRWAAVRPTVPRSRPHRSDLPTGGVGGAGDRSPGRPTAVGRVDRMLQTFAGGAPVRQRDRRAPARGLARTVGPDPSDFDAVVRASDGGPLLAVPAVGGPAPGGPAPRGPALGGPALGGPARRRSPRRDRPRPSGFRRDAAAARAWGAAAYAARVAPVLDDEWPPRSSSSATPSAAGSRSAWPRPAPSWCGRSC